MNVINSGNTAHEIKLIPRFYPTTGITFITYNEATQESTTIANSYVILNGLLTLSFNLTVSDGDKLQFEINESGEVIYRGKLIATTQTTQEFKQTNGLYYYE